MDATANMEAGEGGFEGGGEECKKKGREAAAAHLDNLSFVAGTFLERDRGRGGGAGAI